MKSNIFILILAFLFVSACSSGQVETEVVPDSSNTFITDETQEPTNTPPPSSTPLPSQTLAPTKSSTPTTSSSPDPYNTDNWQEYNSALDPNKTGLSESNFSVKFPSNWENRWDPYGGSLFELTSGDIDAGDLSEIYAQHNVLIIPDLFRYPPKVNTLYDWRNDMDIITEPVVIKINDQDAAKAIYKSDEFVLLVGWIVKDDASVFFGAYPSLEENLDALPLLETILNSIHIAPTSIPAPSGIDQEITDTLEHILITEEYLKTLLDDDWELTLINEGDSFWLKGSEKLGSCKEFSSSSQSILTCRHSVSSEDPLSEIAQLLPDEWINVPSNKSYPHDVAFYGVLDDSGWVIHGYMPVEKELLGMMGFDLFFVEFDGIQIDEGLPIEETLTRYVDDYVGEILLYSLSKLSE